MFRDTITVFNFHEASGQWYPSVISGADLGVTRSQSATTTGMTNADTVTVLVQCAEDRSITTADGVKRFADPKEYAKSTAPAEFITFAPECDFIFAGAWAGTESLVDDDHDSGLYHAMNEAHDGVYMITSAGFFGLLPHFEIGGR